MAKDKRKNPLDVEQQNLVECIIDEHGLEGVLIGMADVCYDRADTKGDMWKGMRSAWRRSGKMLDVFALEIPL